MLMTYAGFARKPLKPRPLATFMAMGTAPVLPRTERARRGAAFLQEPLSRKNDLKKKNVLFFILYVYE